MMSVTLYHNPRCSKSRQTLALLQEKGIEPTIINYLENPPKQTELKQILQLLGVKPRDIMRKNEEPYKTLSLNDATLSDSQLIKAIVDNPILLQRPIVVANGKAAIGRPPENVLEIL